MGEVTTKLQCERVSDASIEVYRLTPDPNFNDPYPWRFAVTFDGVRRTFAGMPNKCASPAQAFRRAITRLKWLEDGTFNQRYK